MLAGGVYIPEASLQGMGGMHRACARQLECRIDGLACRPHHLLRGELEAGALLQGRRVAGTRRGPERIGLVEDERTRGTKIG